MHQDAFPRHDITVNREEARRVLGPDTMNNLTQNFAQELLAAEKRIKELEAVLDDTAQVLRSVTAQLDRTIERLST